MRAKIFFITLAVDDLDRSVGFYRDGLGWPTEGIVGQEFHDEVTGADGTIAIFTLDGGLRRRIFLLEEQPAALTDSYYPADMAGGTAIEQPGRIKGGVHALIEDPAGPIRRQVACSVDDIAGRMPTPGEARELKLPPGVPVFRVLRTVYDADGRPLEVQDSVAAADRHQFRYEVEMR